MDSPRLHMCKGAHLHMYVIATETLRRVATARRVLARNGSRRALLFLHHFASGCSGRLMRPVLDALIHITVHITHVSSYASTSPQPRRTTATPCSRSSPPVPGVPPQVVSLHGGALPWSNVHVAVWSSCNVCEDATNATVSTKVRVGQQPPHAALFQRVRAA
ncbi:hypothetical protein PTSG_06028 [Salpingoeca rosetta]|uniref:Uncharacterized protein n=1 Tax=Salpingoeca rosetta (strain ATCC 50818 / BSB-021) TaxID=946362 RepID=F2UDG9_SALR5|nr:uncharacterized protein PTSG_06028 [Salpingoeca rosetta]EGD74664.1 hypothetical protein PTSG_06028 [Salpingoeca rosetta]|eukprot:XP_004992921.1 hypothetical protein PTSG_06028 [Salpingoeca rosetta]